MAASSSASSSTDASWVPSWLKPWPAAAAPVSAQTRDNVAASAQETSAQAGPSRLVDQPEQEPQAQEYTSQYLLDDDEEEQQRRFGAGPTLGIPVTGAALGFGAGFYQSAKRAGLVFMAENAHRRPDTVQGWYFYNKTKNYRVLFAAMKGGIRTGMRMGLWTLVFVTFETGIRRLRQGEDVWRELRERGFLSPATAETHMTPSKPTLAEQAGAPSAGRFIDGAGAGLGIAMGASLLYRLPTPVARRVLFFGTGMGGAVGAMRDLHALLLHKKLEHEASQTDAHASKPTAIGTQPALPSASPSTS